MLVDYKISTKFNNMLGSVAIVFLQPQMNPLREVLYIDEVYTVKTESVVWFSHKAAEVFHFSRSKYIYITLRSYNK